MKKLLGIGSLAIIIAAAGCDSPIEPKVRPVPAPGSSFDVGNTVGGDCDEMNPCDIPVLEPGGVSPPGLIVPGAGVAACAGTLPDADQDGFNDDCEYRLAAAFAPQLRFTSGDGDVSRETYWAVTYKPGFWPSSTVTIAYLLGYHTDGGYPPALGATGHVGDSEFIFIELRTQGGEFWDGHRAYTSAHWGTSWDRSETHEYNNLQYVSWAGGRARFYVAKNKHASYNSAAKCGWGADICGPSHFNEDVAVLPNRNVGSPQAHLLDCVGSSTGLPYYNGVECFWQPSYFRGWQGASASFTSHAGTYRSVLNYWQSRANNM